MCIQEIYLLLDQHPSMNGSNSSSKKMVTSIKYSHYQAQLSVSTSSWRCPVSQVFFSSPKINEEQMCILSASHSAFFLVFSQHLHQSHHYVSRNNMMVNQVTPLLPSNAAHTLLWCMKTCPILRCL